MSTAASWPEDAPSFADDAQRRAALSGRVAVITGASRGLGAGLAVHFASAGLRLGLCARHRPELVVSTRPRAHDGRIERPEAPLAAPVDVGDHAALAAFARAVAGRFGPIDLWVNNAGVLDPVGPLAEADPAAAADHLQVNLNGVLFGTMLFAAHVRQRAGGGTLVNISSGAARQPYAGWGPYCAGKAAVERLTEVVDLEERPHGLRAYAVAPGLVDTDMQALVRAADERRFPEVARFRAAAHGRAFNAPGWVAERLLELAFGAPPPAQTVLRVPADPHAGTS